MKVLVLCDRFPFPLYNGQNLRIYHYVRLLRERHQFDLLCYGESEPPPELNELFGEISWHPPPMPDPRSSLAWLAVTLFAPWRIAPYPPFAEELRARLASGHYDLVWMSGWDTVINVPRPCPIPFLADIVDDGVLEYWREFRRRRGIVPRLRGLRRVLENAVFERYFFGPADTCLIVSERDAEVFRRVNPNTSVAVIANGVDEAFFRPGEGEADDPTLVLEGTLLFRPNIDAARFLVDEILPLVQREIPSVRVTLVGRDPVPEVRALAGPAVTVTGFVDDVRPYLDQATVFVCPMRKGAGVKNKLLQAWAMGKAVAATPLATGGLAVRSGENIVIAEGAKALADAIVGLLGERGRRSAIGAAGRETVLARYTWRQKADELERVMMDTVERREVEGRRAPA